MADKRPAYQRYPKDYLSDENVALMSLEQEGAYNRLMDYCWLQGSIPGDLASLARLCRVTEQDMERVWPGVEKCFRRSGNRYTHPRLDIERQKQDAHRKAKSEAGKAGAKAKHHKDNSGSATVLPVAESSFAVCSLQFASASPEERVAEKQTLSAERAMPEPPRRTTAHPEMAQWLGAHATCLDGVDIMAQRSVWGIWGPHGTNAHDWRGMSPERQAPIMAAAILSWMADRPTRFYRPLFAKILARAIDDAIASERQAEQRGTEEATANEAREAARLHEQREIERLNAEAAKAGTGPVSTPQARPARGSGLARLSA